MASTYDLTTDIGKLRLLVGDTRITDAKGPIFDDGELQTFIDMEAVNSETQLKLSAALAIEVIAGDIVKTLKVIQLLDVKTDGAATSREMRALAKSLRDAANAEDPGFDIAVMINSPAQYVDWMYKQLLKEAA